MVAAVAELARKMKNEPQNPEYDLWKDPSTLASLKRLCALAKPSTKIQPWEDAPEDEKGVNLDVRSKQSHASPEPR